ncbi:MAG: Hsp20/alpha crystallin family protein [Phycisphaerales bacterium]
MQLSLWKRHNPFNGELQRLREEMDRTIDRLLGGGFIEPRAERAEGWMPLIDLSETDSEVVIRAEVPGIDPADMDISLTGRTLVISGEKQETKERKGEDYHQCERRFGAFRRSIELPEGADPDRVSAESDAGVLTIRVARVPSVKPRHIEVKALSGRRPQAVGS